MIKYTYAFGLGREGVLMKTLLINAHPEFDSEMSYSSKLQKYFVSKFTNDLSANDLEILNLFNEYIPQLNSEMLTLFGKQSDGKSLTENEQKIADRMAELMAQFKRCKRIVIVIPMHNFNIPSKLKDYIDNILIARETLKYIPIGSIVLITDDRKVLLLQSSGSVYTNDDRYTPIEFSHFYLKAMFVEIMGFDSFDIVRAQGTATGTFTEKQILNQAYADMEVAFNKFYGI
jgi:FMN-dependent NADH-azoreductase